MVAVEFLVVEVGHNICGTRTDIRGGNRRERPRRDTDGGGGGDSAGLGAQILELVEEADVQILHERIRFRVDGWVVSRLVVIIEVFLAENYLFDLIGNIGHSY